MTLQENPKYHVTGSIERGESVAITTKQRNAHLDRNPIAKQANELYIEFANDFLTVERFAEWHDLPLEYAQALIKYGRELHRCEIKAFPSQ